MMAGRAMASTYLIIADFVCQEEYDNIIIHQKNLKHKTTGHTLTNDTVATTVLYKNKQT